MIIPEKWPVMPTEELVATDARLTEAIGAISIHHPSEFTEREQLVMYYATQGKSNKEIGAAVHLSENTIKTHFRTAYEVTGVSDEANLAYIGLNSGWISHKPATKEEWRMAKQRLTPMRALCFKGIILGLSNKAIGTELGIEDTSVKSHLHSLRMGARSGMVRQAFQFGMLVPSALALDVIYPRDPLYGKREEREPVKFTGYRTETVMTRAAGKISKIRTVQVAGEPHRFV